MQIWIVTIALLLSSWATAQYATDSCVVFEVDVPAVKMMGYMPTNPEWTEINYVIHIHHTDSFPDSYLPETVIYDAHDHLNQELEEAMFSFNLMDVEYHDFDEFELAPLLVQEYLTCIPYSYMGWANMNQYVEDLVWDREIVMNVHVFPQFCAGILGFAWTAYSENTPMEGVWVRTDVFGRVGDHLTYPRNENKTLIHEVGHYLGLHHVFRNVEYCGQNLGDCEESGDYVCDTPPTKINWSCENPICPPGLYNYTPNNHMDYYVDSCRTNFTEGQIERMHDVLPVTRPGMVSNPYCAGDISGDFVVGMNDMLMMLANIQNLYWEEGDLNDDGILNVYDLQIILVNWGNVCFGAEIDPFYREEQFNYPKQERGRSPFPSRW